MKHVILTGWAGADLAQSKLAEIVILLFFCLHGSHSFSLCGREAEILENCVGLGRNLKF
ncbi:hypothetical protein ACU4GH_01290 [Bradyrhizobium betae]